MSWDRFHFICRQAQSYLNSGHSLDLAISKAESYGGNDLYGRKIKPGSLADKILQTIKTRSPSEASKLLSLYGQLDMQNVLKPPSKLILLTAYLVFLTLAFTVMSFIYQLFVAPKFLGFFETMDIPPPETLSWYVTNWSFITLIILLLVIISIIVNIELKGIFSLTASSTSISFRWLIPRKIKQGYLNAIELMTYPVQSMLTEANLYRGVLSQHLEAANKNDLNVVTEMNILLRREGDILTALSQRYIQSLLTVIFIAIILSIFFFISSAYAPIFVMGEAV